MTLLLILNLYLNLNSSIPQFLNSSIHRFLNSPIPQFHIPISLALKALLTLIQRLRKIRTFN